MTYLKKFQNKTGIILLAITLFACTGGNQESSFGPSGDPLKLSFIPSSSSSSSNEEGGVKRSHENLMIQDKSIYNSGLFYPGMEVQGPCSDCYVALDEITILKDPKGLKLDGYFHASAIPDKTEGLTTSLYFSENQKADYQVAAYDLNLQYELFLNPWVCPEYDPATCYPIQNIVIIFDYVNGKVYDGVSMDSALDPFHIKCKLDSMQRLSCIDLITKSPIVDQVALWKEENRGH